MSVELSLGEKLVLITALHKYCASDNPKAKPTVDNLDIYSDNTKVNALRLMSKTSDSEVMRKQATLMLGYWNKANHSKRSILTFETPEQDELICVAPYSIVAFQETEDSVDDNKVTTLYLLNRDRVDVKISPVDLAEMLDYYHVLSFETDDESGYLVFLVAHHITFFSQPVEKDADGNIIEEDEDDVKIHIQTNDKRMWDVETTAQKLKELLEAWN